MPQIEGSGSKTQISDATVINGKASAPDTLSRAAESRLLRRQPVDARQPPAKPHRNGLETPRSRKRAFVPVVIVGAGPFGLSIAAHLLATGVEFRIFGEPMQTWRRRMPSGMLLKSEGFASNIYDPDGDLTLARFCADNGLPYAPLGLPIALETISAYGLDFRRRHVPGLEEKFVLAIELESGRFTLRLDDGEQLTAAQVVVATGFNFFEHIPASLESLPRALVSHSSAHSDLAPFAGRDVTVIGAGASAIDIAALLHAAGAAVRLVARRDSLVFNPPPELPPRPLWRRLRYPRSEIGNGLHSRFYTDFPGLFRWLPEDHRVAVVRDFLGPAAAWYIKPKIAGRIPVLLGRTQIAAEPAGSRVRLRLADPGGACQEITTEHVIAATGYRPDVRRVAFLSERLRANLRTVGGAPELSSRLESSVPGLYFVGLASANCFGPVMRFMCGARFTARTLARHLAKRSQKTLA
jgi:cation diffusion facilitator CzcD-associated flavoprotein CzcO